MILRQQKARDSWFLVYVDNMVNTTAVEDAIMTNIMNRCHDTETEERLLGLMESVIANRDVQQVDTIEKAAAGVLAGDTVIFMEGSSFALQASTRGYPNRGVGHTETEVVVQGPKDAFTELLAFNLVLIRRRIQDPRLKVVRTKAGSRTKTDVALMYFSDLVRPGNSAAGKTSAGASADRWHSGLRLAGTASGKTAVFALSPIADDGTP